VVWVHAVSVGESMAAVPLIVAMLERDSAIRIVVTTTTSTGADNVERMLGDSVEHVYFPYDLPVILRRFLARFKPRILIILETELWPNTVDQCRAAGVPVVLVNARLSEKSLSGYSRVAAFSRALIQSVNAIAAQSVADANRFLQMGASAGLVEVTGSLKFDIQVPASVREEAEVLKRKLGVNRPVIVFGSTREGEEALLLDAVFDLKAEFENLLFIFAPRHPERFVDVAELFRSANLHVVTQSSGAPCSEDVSVYIADSMGELPRFYAAADVAFVGGSLLPYGGHNVLEPAALGTPVLSGPYTQNFAETCTLLRSVGALIVVDDGDELVHVAGRWLKDSNERDRVGQLGSDVVREHGGATRRTLELVDNHILSNAAEI